MPNYLDKIASEFIAKGADRESVADESHLLNDTEAAVIKKTYVETLTAAGILGVLGVLILYLPQYWFPEFFPNYHTKIFGFEFDLPLVSSVYGFILVYAEIYGLTYFNLKGVRKIAEVCQFPRKADVEYERHLTALVEAALEKENKGLVAFGINPYLGLPKWVLMLFFVFNKLKATLSNIFVKIFLKRFLGRYAVREVTDLAGIPIFAFWNVWASHWVIHEAKIRIIAPQTVRLFIRELSLKMADNEQFQSIILEALQFVSILKRQYNYSHFLLTEDLIKTFKIQDFVIKGNFLERLEQCEVEVRKSLEQLIVFGVLIDGDLNWLEKSRLKKMIDANLLSYSMDEIEQIGRDYEAGKGMKINSK
ncbi:MAG: LBF_2804 family protein [Spirosomataceae bacterium]